MVGDVTSGHSFPRDSVPEGSRLRVLQNKNRQEVIYAEDSSKEIDLEILETSQDKRQSNTEGELISGARAILLKTYLISTVKAIRNGESNKSHRRQNSILTCEVSQLEESVFRTRRR